LSRRATLGLGNSLLAITARASAPTPTSASPALPPGALVGPTEARGCENEPPHYRLAFRALDSPCPETGRITGWDWCRHPALACARGRTPRRRASANHRAAQSIHESQLLRGRERQPAHPVRIANVEHAPGLGHRRVCATVGLRRLRQLPEGAWAQ